jgi:hypothetical protein
VYEHVRHRDARRGHRRGRGRPRIRGRMNCVEKQRWIRSQHRRRIVTNLIKAGQNTATLDVNV